MVIILLFLEKKNIVQVLQLINVKKNHFNYYLLTKAQTPLNHMFVLHEAYRETVKLARSQGQDHNKPGQANG